MLSDSHFVVFFNLSQMAGANAAFFGCPIGGSIFALEITSRFGIEYFEHAVEAVFSGTICMAVFRTLAGMPIGAIWSITSVHMSSAEPVHILYGGLLIFFAHNLLDYPEAARKGNLNLFWSFVHGRNAVMPLNSSHLIFVAYSFLPWTGIMILGFCAGRLFDSGVTPATRKKWLTGLGFGLLVYYCSQQLTCHLLL